MIGIGPLDFDEFAPEETIEQQNHRLKDEIHQLSLAYGEAVSSIKFLIAHCQKNGIDPFPEGQLTLQEAVTIIRQLTPEQLKKRNEEVTRRIVPRVKNPESAKMKDAMESQQKMVEEFKENPLIALLSGKQEIGAKKVITLKEFCDAVQGQEETNFVKQTLIPHVSNSIKEHEFMIEKVLQAEDEFFSKNKT